MRQTSLTLPPSARQPRPPPRQPGRDRRLSPETGARDARRWGHRPHARLIALGVYCSVGLVAGVIFGVMTAQTAQAITLQEAFDRAKIKTPESSSNGSLGQTSQSRSGAGSKRWSAFAAAIWEVDGTAKITIGSAMRFASKKAAMAHALQQCRKGHAQNCKIVATFNQGCGYITTGRTSRTRVAWIIRKTRARVRETCREKGYTCKRIIGGCT